MLSIHILNVGHGDSIVLEYRHNGSSAFAVIDSNVKSGQTPKALQKLQSLGATNLSFVAITHPHADHFLGMKAILEAYDGKVDNIYTFPIPQESKKLQEIATKYMDSIADSTDLGRNADEFLNIFKFAKKTNWESPSGTISPLNVPGFKDVEIKAILPPARYNNSFYDNLLNGNLQLESSNQNDVSLAFLVEYKGHQIVLGGDGTKGNWEYQAKRWPGVSTTLKPIASKLPHHGSKEDSSRKVLDIIYGDDDLPDRVACISAEGSSHHPHNDVIDALVSKQIKPYCTNLAIRCGNNIKSMVSNPDIDPALLRLINSISLQGSVIKEQPCQGDISLVIKDDGEFTVNTEHKHLCQYRGDYAFIPITVN